MLLLLLCCLLATSSTLDTWDYGAVMAMVEQMAEKMREEMKEEIEAVEEKFKKEAAAMKWELEAVKMEAAFTKTSLATLEASLPKTISQAVRDVPYFTGCALRDKWTTPSARITYDYLVSETDRPGGGNGDFDILAGVFTCLTSGHYTVTYSGHAFVEPGEYVVVSVYKNSGSIGSEGNWWSYNGGLGLSQDQGSHTVVRECYILLLLPLTTYYYYYYYR